MIEVVRRLLGLRWTPEQIALTLAARPWIPPVNRNHLQLHLRSAGGRAQA